jgi:hypothetical protein
MSHRKVKQPHGLGVTMSRVKSIGVSKSHCAARRSLQSFRSHPQSYDSFRVTTSRHDSVSYESRVGSHVATVESQVISHELRSRKETVRVTSRFRDRYIYYPFATASF